MIGLDGDGLPIISAIDADKIISPISGSNQYILVGGQAVNFWADIYASLDPEIALLAPFSSSDIDIFASRSAVIAAAERLGGKLYLPSFDDHTPNSGKLVLSCDGVPVEIDFMATVEGVSNADVRESCIKMSHPASNNILFVMHPMHCLEGKIANYGGVNLQKIFAKNA